MEKTVSRKYSVLGAVFTVVLALLSTLLPFCAPFAGAALAVVILNSKKPWLPAAVGALTIGIFYAASLLFGGIYWFSALAVTFAVTAIMLSALFKKALPLKTIIISASVVLGGSLIAFGTFYIWQKGGSISKEGVTAAFAWITERIDSFSATFLEALAKEASAETVKLYENFFETVKTSVTDYYLPMSPSLCVYFGFLTMLPSVLFVKNAAPACDTAKIGRFGSMRTQRLFAILMAAAYIASMFMSDDVLGLTIKNITVASLGYYVAAGYSFISFLMSVRGAKVITRYLVYIISAAVCFLTLGLDIIALLGILEGILQTRRRFDLIAARYGATGGSIKEMMDKLKDAAEKEERGRQNSDVPWYEREESKEKNEEENKDDPDDKGGNDE